MTVRNYAKFSIIAALLTSTFLITQACQFFPVGEYLRFVRVPENIRVGEQIMEVEVHPRKTLNFEPIDKDDDITYFSYKTLNRTWISITLARPLDDLVDRDTPQNVLKFRLSCDGGDLNDDRMSSYLSFTIYIEDVNDNSPTFVDAPYLVNVDELTPVGLTIFRGIHAIDRDKPNTPNSEVFFTIVSGNAKGHFALENSHRANVIVRKPLDYDKGERKFVLGIMAADRGVPPHSVNTTLTVNVLDNDDLNPKFSMDVYRAQITEHYPVTNKKIHKPLKFNEPIYAYDQDLGLNSAIRYDIVSGENHFFSIDTHNGTMFLEKEVDLEMEPSLPGNTFILQIQATQTDNLLKTAVARVEIEVIDINDNVPVFEVDFYNISIVENLPNGFSVLQVLAEDRDQGSNGEFTYVLDDTASAFNLDPRNGWLTVRDQAVLDREKSASLSLKIYAKEKTQNVVTQKFISSSTSVIVTLLDANDNNPTFIPNNLYEFTIDPETKVGDHVGSLKAVDPDLGRNGMVLYSIQKTNSSVGFMQFGVNSQTGDVMVLDAPFSEEKYTLFVEASDQPVNPSERRYSLAVVTINVEKQGVKAREDTELPEFVGAPYEFWVGNDVGIGTSVGQLRVTDPVKKANVIYDLLHSYHEGVPFAVEERSGMVTVINDLHRFERDMYEFEAVVTNDRDLFLITNVTIHVVSDDLEKGTLMRGTTNVPLTFHVRENMAGAMIGQLIHSNVTKNITNKSLKFVIASQPEITELIAISQDGTLYTKKGLNREEKDVYKLTIIAEYVKGHLTGAGIYQVTIVVDDENDNPPKFSHPTYQGQIREGSRKDTQVILDSLIIATDQDDGINAQFQMTLFGDGQEYFHVNQTTGRLIYVGDAPLDREIIPQYNFKLIARDRGNLFSEAKLTVVVEDVNDNAPEFLQMVVLPDKGIQILEFDEKISNITLIEQIKNGVYTINHTHVKGVSDDIYLTPLISIPENVPVGTTILKLVAKDADVGQNAVIRFNIDSESYVEKYGEYRRFNGSGVFMIHPVDGDVFISRILPAESEFRLNISAVDALGLRDNITIRVFVKDINDHAPRFKKSWYSFETVETGYSRDILGKVEATDGDFSANANISYLIDMTARELPFSISEFSGVLSASGELDREMYDKYSFKVIAKDNPIGEPSLSSVVNVEVNILDANDNAPVFYGFDRLVRKSYPASDSHNNHKMETMMVVPVYYASVSENAGIGQVITKIYANDSDFQGNGNGLILYDIQHRKNQPNMFIIDSKDGTVSTIGKFDYEKQNVYNVTIVASDLGSPSLSSTALLTVSVIDAPDVPGALDDDIFDNRFYEVNVEENIQPPLNVIDLKVADSYKHVSLVYTIVADVNDLETRGMFRILPKNGTLVMVKSPDRERRDVYEVIVRADRLKSGRMQTEMVYPVGPDKLTGLKSNEIKVIVHITDVNDNAPKFLTNAGRPIVAAIPASASYGFEVVRLEATDADDGVNAAVRYQIMNRGTDQTRRFVIDAISGHVKSITSFARDAGRVFGFDVKATDREGADDGRSAIANVFVYILAEDSEIIMSIDSRPTVVERNIYNITMTLQNITGYDIRIRKLEPHRMDRNAVDSMATDMYLYAIDPVMNVIVGMKQLEKTLQKRQSEIQRHLRPYRIIDISSGGATDANTLSGSYTLITTVEVAVILMGCTIFLIALVTAICISCRKKKTKTPSSNYDAHMSEPSTATPVSYSVASPEKANHRVNPLFPSVYGDFFQYHSDNGDHVSDSAIYVSDRAKKYRRKYGANHFLHEHPSYRRYRHKKGRRALSDFGGKTSKTEALKNRHLHGVERTSVQSSGKDSGITEGRCMCGETTSHSSITSDGSYEDSLKSTSPESYRTSITKPKRQYSLPPNRLHKSTRMSFRNHIRVPSVRRMSAAKNMQSVGESMESGQVTTLNRSTSERRSMKYPPLMTF